MYTKPRITIFLGPPGSGKGTQAARLSSLLDIPAISTGEMLRRECQSVSELGRALERVIRAGQLVGDDLMNRLVANRLRQSDCRDGCILDGFPRTVSQATFLDDFLAESRLALPVVFDFAVSPEHLIARLDKRRQCPTCGRVTSESPGIRKTLFCVNDGSVVIPRADDQPDAIRERLGAYQSNAAALIRFYKGREYHRIDAGQGPEAVTRDICRAIGLAPSGQFEQVAAQVAGAALGSAFSV